MARIASGVCVLAHSFYTHMETYRYVVLNLVRFKSSLVNQLLWQASSEVCALRRARRHVRAQLCSFQVDHVRALSLVPPSQPLRHL
jgi:hypothetical protein